ncbi:type II secretion system protein [Patescibacteria group bacterium]|nr:type II secretion system protein [Patescibacteria group bacterium]
MKKTTKGFTLLEILLVVAAIAILAGIVILAINPAKQLGDTKNAARSADVNTILNAVYQYTIDNNGSIPATITASSTEICSTSTCTGLIDLSVLTENETYLTAFPIDPDGAVDENGTGYAISKSNNGRITVSSLKAQDATISVTK